MLVAGLVLGAGIPALFAVGVRLTASGRAAAMPDGIAGPEARCTVTGAACFLVAALAVALGIPVVVAAGFGKTVSFEHVFPTLVDKA